MIEAPIVEEVHRSRERLLAKYGGMDGLRRVFRAIDDEMRDRVVRLEPRPTRRMRVKGRAVGGERVSHLLPTWRLARRWCPNATRM